MKNPLEYTMLEIAALLRLHAGGPESEFNHLLLWIKEKQEQDRAFVVQRERELAKAEDRDREPRGPSLRKLRDMDRELLDEAEIVVGFTDGQNSAETNL